MECLCVKVTLIKYLNENYFRKLETIHWFYARDKTRYWKYFLGLMDLSKVAAKCVKIKDFPSLVDIILSGHSKVLETVASSDQEMKSFLDTVPVINKRMREINRAIEEGSVKDLEYLLTRKKFSLMITDTATQSSLLHKAVSHGHEDVARYLSKCFPELLYFTDVDGRTALHLAALRKNDKIFNLLSRRGSDVGKRDKFDRTPSQYMFEAMDPKEIRETLPMQSQRLWISRFGKSGYLSFEQGLSFALSKISREMPPDPVQRLSQLLIIYEFYSFLIWRKKTLRMPIAHSKKYSTFYVGKIFCPKIF